MASESETTAYLHEKWECLTSSTAVTESAQEKWWDFLKSCYSEPSRKYYTFSHLRQMFEEMEKVIDEIENKDAMSYAIFFHDTGYDVHSQDNEEKSFEYFSEFSKDAETEQVLALAPIVEQLIVASKSCNIEHKIEDSFGKEDMYYFMDLDISILGSEPSEYKKCADQIREEYSFLTKHKYNSLRIKVLQQFLQIPKIYATELFYMKYETQARCNIQNEIDSLQNE